MARKGENIYKRKDNRWEARYQIGYDENGKVKYGYCYAKTYQEAKEKQNKAKANVLLGLPKMNKTKKTPFTTCCNEWIQLNRTRVKESTYSKYRTVVEKHIIPELGGFSVDCISTTLIERFGFSLLSGKNLSSKTVKDILVILNSIIKYMQKHYPESNRNIEIIYPKEQHHEMRVLSPEEQTLLINELIFEMDVYKFGILLSLVTGLRLGELCALKWKDISIQEKTLTVSSTMQRIIDYKNISDCKTKIILCEPKSFNSFRIIPLPDCILPFCNKFVMNRGERFVLSNDRKEYTEPRTMQYQLSKILMKCKIHDAHFHTLRHTFATRCVEADFEIKSLSEILGHSSPKITLERYVHSSLELKRTNMNKMQFIRC